MLNGQARRLLDGSLFQLIAEVRVCVGTELSTQAAITCHKYCIRLPLLRLQ